MLKIVFICMLFFVFLYQGKAIDACDRFVPEEVSYEIKIIKNAYLRDFPCIDTSTILWTSQIGDSYSVTRKVHGYYEIQDIQWKTYWIWEEAVQKIEWYTLSSQDNEIVDLFILKLQRLVDKKGYTVKLNFESKLEKVLEQYTLSQREEAVLKEVQKRLNEVNTSHQSSENIENIHQEGQWVQENELWKEALQYSELEKYDINFSQIKAYWLDLYEQQRNKLWLHTYSYDEKLEESAFEWSKTQKEAGEVSHKRFANSSYYDYSQITDWFQNRGIICENKSWYTHTENIWWGKYSCSDGDCNDELKTGLKRTFDFYMSEKDKSYQPHYSSIVNHYFKNVGVWIALKELSENNYEFYLTMHFCTN